MNPALLNYYQQLMQQPQGTIQPGPVGSTMGQAGPSTFNFGQPATMALPAQPPAAPPPAQVPPGYNPPQTPAQQPQIQQSQQPQQVNNPFDAGIRRAIESARESLGMTNKQQEANLRNSMLNFAQNFGQQPRTKGFFENFGAASRALIPAISAYDQGEEAYLNANNQLANQILDRNAATQARAAEEEQRRWQRQHMENQLAETRRYHNIMQNHYNNMGGGNMAASGALRQVFTPIVTKAQARSIGDQVNGFGAALHELDKVKKLYDDYIKDYTIGATEGEGGISPLSPYGRALNPVHRLFGNYLNSKDSQEQMAKLANLESELKKFILIAENKLRGSGSMGPGVLEYFRKENLFPNLREDNEPTFDLKFSSMAKTLEDHYNAARLSLMNGVVIDPSQLGKAQELLGTGQTMPQASAPAQSANSQQPVGDKYSKYVIVKSKDGRRAPILKSQLADAVRGGAVEETGPLDTALVDQMFGGR